ncbi:DUF3192 domain-containing protein [Alteromonas facilis]|uniref:DUF3192 domain-containing protein n=1 Tax=Alteromonas facilis TaxID=2048004 RepID=UPI000C289520|nr:DUF3192 domain-containing protein [Alteromonas facilis]
MNSKVIKMVIGGFALYAVFVYSVVSFFPDSPDDMDWEDREQYNKVQIAKLNLGTSKKEILALLGSPDITEAKKTRDGMMQVMFYRTQHMKSDGITTQNECTPLLFEDDILIAWGDGVYLNFLEG